MNKIYYLKTCNTCMRISKSINPGKDFIYQDIKAEPISVKQLDELYNMTGSYEALFSKRAKLYREMGLNKLKLSEGDIKRYILEHYTFLKRPVVIIDNAVFIGNSSKTVAAIKTKLDEKQ